GLTIQLTDGGPSGTPELPRCAAGPPFGGAPGSAFSAGSTTKVPHFGHAPPHLRNLRTWLPILRLSPQEWHFSPSLRSATLMSHPPRSIGARNAGSIARNTISLRHDDTLEIRSAT